MSRTSAAVQTTSPVAFDGTTAVTRRPPWRVALLLLLFLLALPPRLAGLGEATTEDEDQWVQRSGGFARALALGDWRGTFQIGHPGVTTMWLTTLALGLERARQFADRERGDRLVTQVADFVPALRTARLPFALLGALLTTLCGALAWRLYGAGPGLAGGLLLALDPYWSAMSPIVGMDSLLAGLMASALLCALLAFRPERGAERWALASGVLSGLALLTKGPAVALLPLIPILALLEVGPPPRAAGAWRRAVLKLASWSLGLVLAAAFWPALWVDPFGTLRRTAEFLRAVGGSPHGPGSFFLGQPMADPGPLFYPVALLLRLGPAALLGLLALPIVGTPPAARGRTAPLVIFLLLFALELTLSPKRVDRYLLPLFPALGLLAGLGWWQALRRLAVRWPWPALLPAGLMLIGLLQLWPLLRADGHPLAAYNPLLGGITTAERAIPVGWGEGLDTVGDYLRQQPGSDHLVTAVWYPLWVNFQAHAPGRVVNITFQAPGRVANPQLLEQADFYVDYIHARQRQLTPRFLSGRAPDFVVVIAGVEYARVYRLRP